MRGADMVTGMLFRQGAGFEILATYPIYPGAGPPMLGPEFVTAALRSGPVGFAADLFAQGLVGLLPEMVEHGIITRLPADILQVRGSGDDGCGMAVDVILPARGVPLPASVVDVWGRIAAHYAAAARLRVRGLPEAHAVMDPGGRLLDARGAAAEKSTRDALRRAARAIDRVRGRRIRDAQEALALWRVLTDRRWTLADEFDRGGRRYVVAFENLPAPRATLPGLTARELQVACFVALGHANKQIAYELELSTSTVGTHVSAIRKKLGVTSRAALVRAVYARGFAAPTS